MVEIDKILQWVTENDLYLLLALATVFTIIWLLKFRKRLRMKTWVVLLISVLHVIYGVFCVRAFAAIEGHPGGMSLYGAVFFMPIAYFIGSKVFKRPTSDVFDVFVICMIATLMVARVSCIISGCCLGRCITEDSTLRWPTREIEILFYIAFLICFVPRVYKGRTNGEVYPFYMFTYGALRFVLEFFRESSSGKGLDLSHFWSILSFIVGLCAYITIASKIESINGGKKGGK